MSTQDDFFLKANQSIRQTDAEILQNSTSLNLPSRTNPLNGPSGKVISIVASTLLVLTVGIFYLHDRYNAERRDIDHYFELVELKVQKGLMLPEEHAMIRQGAGSDTTNFFRILCGRNPYREAEERNQRIAHVLNGY